MAFQCNTQYRCYVCVQTTAKAKCLVKLKTGWWEIVTTAGLPRTKCSIVKTQISSVKYLFPSISSVKYLSPHISSVKYLSPHISSVKYLSHTYQVSSICSHAYQSVKYLSHAYQVSSICQHACQVSSVKYFLQKEMPSPNPVSQSVSRR